MPKYWALGAALAVLMGWPLVATAVDPPDEYAKLIQEHSSIGTLDGGFFGDQIGLSTGNLAFVQTDVDLPGNNALAVRVGRQFEVGNFPVGGHFADWDLDIPYLHGTFGGNVGAVGWFVDTVGNVQRCSQFGAPPEIFINGTAGSFTADEYWHGTFFHLPGSGDQELLAGGDVPAGGGYPATTREGAIVRCLPSLALTSETTSSGEGFEVVTPDGTIYTFDQMVSQNASGLHKPDPGFSLMLAAQGSGFGTNSVTCCNLSRREIFLYPTKVTDRFGNTVTYAWSSSNPGQLLSITGSDGRSLSFTYSSSDPTSILVQSVSDGLRTWTYTYTGTIPDVRLATVAQPDQQTWQFNLQPLHRDAKPHPQASACDTLSFGVISWNGTITAPSGAMAQYTLAPKMFGRSWGSRICTVSSTGAESIVDPYLFVGVAITAKTITGPGLPSGGLSWTYAYGSPNNCWNPSGAPTGDADAVICTTSSPASRTTTVTAPDGAVSRYTFGNKVGSTNRVGNEGLLLAEEHGVNGSTALRTMTIEYGDGNAAPYGALQGHSLRRRGDWIVNGQRRPQRNVITALQGKTFTWSVPQGCGGNYCFDTRARSTNVVRTGVNTPTSSQAEVIAYDDDTAQWVLGQVASRTIGGVVVAQTIFDANHLPWKVYDFGKLRQTLTYNTDGTLATVADDNNNVTTYASWKRGIPQLIHFPPTNEVQTGATRTAAVNGLGQITSVTDENGFATGYAYDAMGRISQVTYPTGDTTAWAPTTSVFTPVASSEYGISAGHWRQTVSTGNARKVTYFDALWRPVLVREYDNANMAGTSRFSATGYDPQGRVAHVAYPVAVGPTMSNGTWSLPGVRTTYDALARPTSVAQNSELETTPLITYIEYLPGFQRRTTDARQNVTTEQFMAWDSPTFDLPVQIDAPEGQHTTIVRDIFGKPTAITRGDAP